MDFMLNEEQQMLRDSVARFVERNYAFDQRRRIIDSRDEACAENWSRFAELGWLGLSLPGRLGGFDGTEIDLAILLEELGGALAVEPVLAWSVVAPRLLIASGDERLSEQLVPAIATGRLRISLAHGEPSARGRLSHVETRAEREGGGWRISGGKSLVLGGAGAERFMVSARTSGETAAQDGVTLFLVDANTPGLDRRALSLTDDTRAADLTLNDVALGDEAVIGGVGQAYSALREANAWQLLGICAEALGAMSRAVWITRDYVRTREQFKVPIGTFQALQHRMADMVLETEMSRSMLMRALANFSQGPDSRDRSLSAAKALLGKSAFFVGSQAVQLHGAMGMTDEYPIGAYFRKLLLFRNLLGSEVFHRLQAADMVNSSLARPADRL